MKKKVDGVSVLRVWLEYARFRKTNSEIVR